MCLENKAAANEDFNISTPVATSVLELAQLVWEILNPDEEFSFVSDEAYEYDVQKRIPNTSKAKEMLGFEAEVALEESVREVIDYMRSNHEQ